MTPQLKEAIQAVNKLTPAEKQEFLRIVINTPEESSAPATTSLERILAVQNPITVQDVTKMTADFWPENESADDFLQWREEQKKKDLIDSQKRLEERLKKDDE